jgi:hypothetical protein
MRLSVGPTKGQVTNIGSSLDVSSLCIFEGAPSNLSRTIHSLWDVYTDFHIFFIFNRSRSFSVNTDISVGLKNRLC